ncbi:MAG: HD domain-containing protein [Bacteroidota bacterium]
MNYHAAKAFILHKLETELSDQLTYHGLHHTLDVLASTEELCYYEKVSPYDQILIKTAALYHDSGFTIGNEDHERLGCLIAKKSLPNLGYTPGEVESICGMIMATKVPQNPQTKLEAILCDADLDYLGREDFYEIGNTLFNELKTYKVLDNEKDWNKLQINFLKQHQFFTSTNKKRRNPLKMKHLNDLISATQEG